MSAVRIGSSSFVWAFPFDSTRDLALIARLADLGGDHFDLGVDDPTGVDPEALRRVLDRHGMTLSVGGFGNATRDPSHPDPQVRQAGSRYLRDLIELAGKAGARTVGGPFFGSGGRTVLSSAERDRRLEVSADVLAEASDAAQGAGVRLCIKPINRFENHLLNTAADARALVDRVGHGNLGMTLDTFHMNIEEADQAAAIETAGSKLWHLQVGDNTRGAPGSGAIDWGRIATALRRTGYAGAVTIETGDPDNPVMAELGSLWRHQAASQDALVRDGIAFLRKLLV